MKPFIWLVGGPHFKLITDLSPKDFARIFAKSIDEPHYIPFAGYSGATTILGQFLSDEKFRLQEKCLYRNSGLPYFNGRVRPTGSGSEITGYFSAHYLVIPVMALILFWGILFAAFGCYLATTSLLSGNSDALWALLGAVAALTGVVAAAIFTTVISRKKQEMYLEFFRDIFGATLVERKE